MTLYKRRSSERLFISRELLSDCDWQILTASSFDGLHALSLAQDSFHVLAARWPAGHHVCRFMRVPNDSEGLSEVLSKDRIGQGNADRIIFGSDFDN
jgi:hypothetical protein